MYPTNLYYYGGDEEATNVDEITETISNDYNDIITSERKNFVGFTEKNGKIDRAFACGIKGEEPNNGTAFCIEGSYIDLKYTINLEYLRAIYGSYDSERNTGCVVDSSGSNCIGSVSADICADGACTVVTFGSMKCDLGGDGGEVMCYHN